MCPDWESNQQLFSSQAGTQSPETHPPGQCPVVFSMNLGLFAVNKYIYWWVTTHCGVSGKEAQVHNIFSQRNGLDQLSILI